MINLSRVAPHCTLLDIRPRKVSPHVNAVFRSKAKEAAIDDVLFKLQDKLLRQLLRLVVPSLSLINLRDVSEEYDEDFPADIKPEISLSRQLLRGFALYTLALHSDIVHRRKMCSFSALGLTEYEASGMELLLDQHDMALMKAVVERRKETTVLAGGLLKRRALNQGGRQKGGGRGNNRGKSSQYPRAGPLFPSAVARKEHL